MVTPTPTKIKNGIIGLKYILEGEAHYGDGNRNEYLSYINCFETKSNNGIYKQFQACWDLASEQNETQIRHFIISFSDRELSVENESDIILAHEWATEFFSQAFPGRQILVATQTDGAKSGGSIIHVHAMVNNCRIGDGKGFSESERSRGYFRIKATEFFKQKFAENNIEYDYGRKHDRSYSLFEREFFDAESTEKLEKHLKAFQTYKAAEAAGADDKTLKPLKAEVSAHKFVWKELLIKNIKDCIAHSTSYDDFVANCPDYGIIYGDSRKHNQFRLTPEEYARYTDAPYPEKKATCRGKTLGGLAKEDLMAYFDSLTSERIEEISAQADEEVENQGISAGSGEVFEAVAEEVQAQPVIEEPEEPKVSKRHTEEEMAETEPFVPTDSKFAELLDYDNLANMPDDEDVLDEEEYDEDEALIEAGFTDELPDEEPDPDEEERLKKWMEETVKEYENIGKFMNGASGGKKINDEDYLDFF